MAKVGRVILIIIAVIISCIALPVLIIIKLIKHLSRLADVFRSPALVPTDEDMAWFWTVIKSSNSDRELLYNILQKHRKHSIITFQQCFSRLAETLKQSPYTDGRQEEEIEDICHWVISQGKEAYMIVLDNPDMMPHSVAGLENKILYGVADRIFYMKYNKAINI